VFIVAAASTGTFPNFSSTLALIGASGGAYVGFKAAPKWRRQQHIVRPQRLDDMFLGSQAPSQRTLGQAAVLYKYVRTSTARSVRYSRPALR
jgi:surfactin synthase thioesterase subunit